MTAQLTKQEWHPGNSARRKKRQLFTVAFSLFYLCVCSSVSEVCMLFITINEACNPMTIIFTLYLNKHNSYSHSLLFSFTGKGTFPNSFQNLPPPISIARIKFREFPTTLVITQWEGPRYPWRNCIGLFWSIWPHGEGQICKNSYINEEKENCYIGNYQHSRVRGLLIN